MQENTKNQSQIANRKSQITWLLFAVVVIVIYFFGLNVPLLGPDEPRYSQVAREMFERGDWVTTTLGGFDWFEKPALLYWLQIASYNIFGVTEFAARFGSALFGLGTILSLWILGRKWSAVSDQQSDENPESRIPNPKSEFANWLALVAASSIGLIAFSRGASFDIILTFPITAAMVAFFIWEISHKEETQRKSDKISVFSVSSAALFFFYFFIGVSLIAKGLVGIVFPFAIVAFYYVLSWKLPSKTFIFSLFWGSVLSFIVASAWYLPMYRANGWKFIDEFFIQHHFQRYTSNKYQHPQPFWFFWVVLPLMTTPWIPFFLASIWNLFSRKNAKTQSEIENETRGAKKSKIPLLPFSLSPLHIFAIAWMLVPLVFFSLSGSKLPGYILPALPAALILTGEYVYRFVQKSERRKMFVKGLALATFLVIAVIIKFFLVSVASTETVKGLVETANAHGYKTEKIVNLYTVSHSLEFYGAGRLMREPSGKQKRYDDFSVLVADAKREPNSQILALVPEKDLPNLTNETAIAESKVLDRNGEHALVIVKAK